MNAKQNQILQLYRQRFPGRSTREMSKDLKINPSRVFRLLNGYEMKVSEYERVKEFLNENQIETPDLYNLTRECEKYLSLNTLNNLIEEMRMLLYCKKPLSTTTEVTL